MSNDRPKRVALEKAGRYLMAAIKRAAPSAKAADSFYLHREGEDILISSADMGAVATELNFDHPSWGHPPFTKTNRKHPGRTHFIEKAADRAASVAADKFADEWMRQFVAETEEWEETQ